MVERKAVVGALAELLEHLRLRAADPARREDIDRLEGAGDAVLVGEPERDDVELQRPDGAEDQVVVAERTEQLRRALLAQLVEPLLQGLHPQRILEDRAAEKLRREVRDAGEGERFTLGEGIADVDRAVIVQADDVARPGLVGLLAVGGHERQRVGDAHLLAEPHVVAAACRAGRRPSRCAGTRCGRDGRDPCWPGS